jgi:3-hydroxyacyl-[acyl-carrier protein] dehydratase/trans-2-decenoyl-[acyl-carrier protein] isomerase
LFGNQAPRIPAPPLLGFDKVTDLSLDGCSRGLGGASARIDVANLQWVFNCHFEDDPVIPGTLMVDALLQLIGVYACAARFNGRGRAVRIDGVRFLREVRPQSGFIDYRIDVVRVLRARQLIVAGGEASVDGRACVTVSKLAVQILSL